MKTDAQLQHDVMAELEWEPSINASQICVSAKDGVVTLSGSVPRYADKMTAESVAKRAGVVKGVANDLEVKIAGSSVRTDADITLAVLNALKWDSTVPEDRIKVTVWCGWVTLVGHVDWGYQKDSAEHVVRNLTGVTGLTNQITEKSRVKPGEESYLGKRR